MAHIFKTFANRLTVGSQTAAGIVNPQKLPYESSVFGGLSILNGPVQIGVAPLTPVPKGVLDIGPSVPTSGPPALSAVNITHPLSGIVINSFKFFSMRFSANLLVSLCRDFIINPPTSNGTNRNTAIIFSSLLSKKLLHSFSLKLISFDIFSSNVFPF